MSAIARMQAPEPGELEAVLAVIAAGAAARDQEQPPRFPHEPMELLARHGALSWNALPGCARPPAAAELALVRSVAAADSAVGRIFDGHLNAVERLAVQADEELAERELAAVRAGKLWAGVWGGEPLPGEGPPATVVRTKGKAVLRGVKTFCSGAGGLQRALVLAKAAGGSGPPLSAWVDLTAADRIELDERWFRGAGLRASVSHRVVFHDAPILACLGGPGAIAEQPWFGRDALRTAASWAGMTDTAVAGALDELAARRGRGALEGLAAGRILAEQRTIDLWLQGAARAMDDAGEELTEVSVQARVAISGACRRLLEEAARACGSRPFATGSALDRARRDLELFLLQHRLDPLLARSGEAALSAR